MSSTRRSYGFKQSRAVVPTRSPAKGRFHAPPRRATVARPGAGEGIAVSIGPVNDENRILTDWLTFPVTPTRIPIAGEGKWQDGIARAAPGYADGEHFISASTEAIDFDGRLEPPLYYQAKGASQLDGVTIGTLDVATEERFRAGLLTSDFGPSPYPGRVDRSDVGVVMDTGGRAGPANFLEPHAFARVLTRIRDTGEIVRLVVGDQYGWNGRASIRAFTWSFEDPDPDVLLFSIAFRGSQKPKLPAAVNARTKTKTPPKSAGGYVTTNGDTLGRIAARELKDPGAWKQLVKLNATAIASMYHYVADPGTTFTSGGTSLVSVKVINVKTHKVGTGGLKNLGPDTQFAAGIRLRVVESISGPWVMTGSSL